jgi:hypothetical protein
LPSVSKCTWNLCVELSSKIQGTDAGRSHMEGSGDMPGRSERLSRAWRQLEHSLESRRDHSCQEPRATGLGNLYAGGVGASANVGETPDRNVPKRTTWEEDITGSRKQGMASPWPPCYTLYMCQRGMIDDSQNV